MGLAASTPGAVADAGWACLLASADLEDSNGKEAGLPLLPPASAVVLPRLPGVHGADGDRGEEAALGEVGIGRVWRPWHNTVAMVSTSWSPGEPSIRSPRKGR